MTLTRYSVFLRTTSRPLLSYFLAKLQHVPRETNYKCAGTGVPCQPNYIYRVVLCRSYDTPLNFGYGKSPLLAFPQTRDLEMGMLTRRMSVTPSRSRRQSQISRLCDRLGVYAQCLGTVRYKPLGTEHKQRSLGGF